MVGARNIAMIAALIAGLLCSSASALVMIHGAQPLAEYDALFCREKGWTGADAVYSVGLSSDVTLWLFGDTWIGDVVEGRHTNAKLVNNSIGLQRGGELSKVKVEFFWDKEDDDKPSAFIKPANGVGWFWIFDGVMDGGKLYLFLMQIVKSGEKGVFGFKQVGTWIGEVENPTDEPGKWRIKQYNVPWGRYSKGGNMFFGSAVMKDGDFVYIYGADEDWSKGMGGRSMIAARVPCGRIADFVRWRFYSNDGWTKDVKKASKLFAGTATEYSVNYQPSLKRYVTIYTENGLSKNIMMRTSAKPVGPWGNAIKIYECPEVQWHKSYFCYAAKGHPEISGKDELIVTYVCNSHDFWQMAKDSRIYRPRFLRIMLTAYKGSFSDIELK